MESKQTVRRDQEIIFTNWTEEEFTDTWDKKIYKLAPGKSYYLPFYLAEKFAKNLADREYNKAWQIAFEKHSKKSSNMTRAQIENLATQDTKLNRQEMIDKCVTIIPEKPEDVGMVRPKEVPLKEVVLRRDERAVDLEAKYGNVGSQVNRKALKQAETSDEEFER